MTRRDRRHELLDPLRHRQHPRPLIISNIVVGSRITHVERNQRARFRFYSGVVARTERDLPHERSSNWPTVPCVDPATGHVDPIAEIARHLALGLQAALDGVSLRAAEKLTGVSYSTISKILNGRSWPDVATLAKLEAGLDTQLWPGRLAGK